MAYKDYEDQKAAWRKHYSENKEKYAERQRRRKEEARAFLREYKESNPCTDCGVFYPHYVMDFDHLDASEKYRCVSHLVSHTLNTIIKEIEKCELVCSNCHRIRTNNRG